MAKVCEYYFAPQSPWSYLGHARLLALAKQYNVQIDDEAMSTWRKCSAFPAGCRWPSGRRKDRHTG